MPVKEVFSPFHGHNVKFGRNRPAKHPLEYLRFADYRKSATGPLPTPPPNLDLSPAAMPSLSDIFDNDKRGDCVIAQGWHILGVMTGNAGNLVVGTNAQIIADYSAIGGYVPGDPNTDNGCDEVTAFNYWISHGFANTGTKLAGWLAVDATNQSEMLEAAYLFENLAFALELPDAYTNPFPSGNGFLWDVAGPPNPEQGHAIAGVGYNDFSAQGAEVDTWAMLGTFTYAGIAQYCVPSANGSCVVLISPAAITKAQAKAPNGFDWAQLVADFDAMGGDLPIPSPGPTPTTTPDVGIFLSSKTVQADPALGMKFVRSPIAENQVLTAFGAKEITLHGVWKGETAAPTTTPDVAIFEAAKVVQVNSALGMKFIHSTVPENQVLVAFGAKTITIHGAWTGQQT